MNPLLGIIASQNYPRVVNSYESIATVLVGSGGSAQIDFTSIPSTFKHLQLRYIYQGAGEFLMTMNGDNTTSNYIRHFVYGNGSSVSAGRQDTPAYVGYMDSVATSSFSGGICDILDYTNTNKQRVVRTLVGNDRNGTGDIVFYSGMPKSSTTAISSLRLVLSSGLNIAQYSHFALYGIKG